MGMGLLGRGQALSSGRLSRNVLFSNSVWPEKTFLFEINPADCVADLNKKSVSEKLKQTFKTTNIELSKQSWQ
jgi:hypothetical protein